MELPTWAYDEVLAFATPSAIRLALALYRHGSAQVSGHGSRRSYWRGSKGRLARMAGIQLPALRSALTELTETGLIIIHNSEHRRADAIALSALIDRDGAEDFLHLDVEVKKIFSTPESETCIHDDVNEIDTDQSSSSCIMHDDDGEENLHHALAEAGASDPSDWLRRWPARDIAAALAEARERPGVRNVGAFARTLLRNGFHADGSKSAASGDAEKSEPASLADRVAGSSWAALYPEEYQRWLDRSNLGGKR